jgi:hypothetical protein
MSKPICQWSASLLLALASWAAWAGPGPYNTGVDDAGTPLALDAVDAHYRIVAPSLFADAYVKNESAGVPIVPGGWVGDNDTSAWIVPSPDLFFGDIPGVTDRITYRTTFDLSGYVPASGRIDGLWAADDTALEIRLNGLVVPNVPHGGYAPLLAFSIETGFLPGINTLEFDTLSTRSPTGLRVEMTSVFAPVPEPGTGFLLVAGGLAIGAAVRGRRTGTLA